MKGMEWTMGSETNNLHCTTDLLSPVVMG